MKVVCVLLLSLFSFLAGGCSSSPTSIVETKALLAADGLQVWVFEVKRTTTVTIEAKTADGSGRPFDLVTTDADHLEALRSGSVTLEVVGPLCASRSTEVTLHKKLPPGRYAVRLANPYQPAANVEISLLISSE